MATQPILIDALGETPVDGPAPAREDSKVLDYLQNFSGTTPLVVLTMEPHRGLSGQDLLSRIMAQRGSDIPVLMISQTGYALARWSLPAVEAIDALRAGGEDEAPPTPYAYERARSIVESAYGQIQTKKNVPKIIPKPLVTSDDVGGIRLSWRTDGKQLRANFGARPEPECRSYIYFEFGEEHGVEPLDSQHLAGRLAWLTGR